MWRIENWLEDKRLKKWFKKVIALCLLPPDTVADAFYDLCEVMYLTLLDEYENLVWTFADYVLTNYITNDETGKVILASPRTNLLTESKLCDCKKYLEQRQFICSLVKMALY